MRDQDPSYLEAPEEWTSFLAALVHELRTPLASFRILADLLIESPQSRLGEQERRYAENIRDVAKDIHSLLGEVGELARLLAGRVVPRPEEVVLGQLVERVLEEVRPQTWQGGIALTESVDPALRRHFRTDSSLLRQALVLLLGHLVGDARSEVYLRLERDGENLRCMLSSDGPPFAEEFLHSLFAPFRDGVRALRSGGGSSLALSLAYQLARALGGTLRAENQGGRPVFVLLLPPIGS